MNAEDGRQRAGVLYRAAHHAIKYQYTRLFNAHYTTLHYTTLHYTSKRRYFHTLSLRTFVFGFDADLDGVRSLALLPLLPLVPVFPPSLL